MRRDDFSQGARAARCVVWILCAGLTAAACGGARAAPSSTLAPREDSLVATSGVACQTDSDCAVCYREGTCGEPIAANDPQVDAPACHVSPAPFCMARRGRCDEQRCVAR